jgi:hypothetical protein
MTFQKQFLCIQEGRKHLNPTNSLDWFFASSKHFIIYTIVPYSGVLKMSKYTKIWTLIHFTITILSYMYYTYNVKMAFIIWNFSFNYGYHIQHKSFWGCQFSQDNMLPGGTWLKSQQEHWPFQNVPEFLTELTGSRSNTFNLYLNGAWFKSGQDPERFFMVFLSPFQYPKLGYDCFFHILSSSLFTLIQSIDSILCEFLTMPLHELQNKSIAFNSPFRWILWPQWHHSQLFAAHTTESPSEWMLWRWVRTVQQLMN